MVESQFFQLWLPVCRLQWNHRMNEHIVVLGQVYSLYQQFE